MKSLLMWGIESEFSTHAARSLAASGHRLLLVGSDNQVLEQLDARLAQSELHRFAATPALNSVSAWVEEQNAGLDGLVVFAQAPEPQPSLFVPLSANVRNSERAVFTVIELIRELLPQLRRGRRPKGVLVILDWLSFGAEPPLASVLTHTWHAVLPSLTAELNKQGSHFNVLCLREPTTPATAVVVEPPPGDSHGASERRVDQEQSSAEAVAPEASEYVQSCLSLLGLCFSPTLSFLNGQFLQHPSPSVSPLSTSMRRQ